MSEVNRYMLIYKMAVHCSASSVTAPHGCWQQNRSECMICPFSSNATNDMKFPHDRGCVLCTERDPVCIDIMEDLEICKPSKTYRSDLILQRRTTQVASRRMTKKMPRTMKSMQSFASSTSNNCRTSSGCWNLHTFPGHSSCERFIPQMDRITPSNPYLWEGYKTLILLGIAKKMF